MSKDVNIDVPCAHYELRAHPPTLDEEKITLHAVFVPEAALSEVQEVLKKYQAEFDKFSELLGKYKERQ